MKSTNRRMTPQGEKVTRSTAVVQLTIEVDSLQPWGADCTIDQVYRQAASDAYAKISRILNGHARIVGEPKVTAVMAEETRR